MRITCIGALLLAACSSSQPAVHNEPQPTPAASELRSTFLTSGHPTGAQIESRAPDGSTVVKFSFNDRGRGPDFTVKTWYDDQEVPQRIEIRGVDYFRVAVKENFVREGDTARWENASEHGSKVVQGPAFYLALSSTPEETAAIVRAALRTPEHRIAALPSGQIDVAAIGTHELTRGAEKKTVTCYAVSGIDFDPTILWLDENNRFFASVEDKGWSSLILEGWEKSADELRDRQKELAHVRLEDLAKKLSRKPEKPVVFQNVAVFDSEGKKLLRDQNVVVRGDKIIAVGPSARTKIPADAEIIDGKGRTLLPGLWDMHVHIRDTDGLMHLAAGVTSVRDLGNDTTLLLDTKKSFDEGKILGPRITFAGFIDGPGPYALQIGKQVTNEAEMRKAIDDYADLGVEQIKLYSSLDPKLVPIAADEAKKHGLRVSGHVPNGMRAADFVEQGADEVHHANFLALNFLDVPDTRTTERFHAVGRESAELELESPKVKAFVALLRKHKTVIDPTLVTFETMFTLRPGEIESPIVPVGVHLPIGVRRWFLRRIAPAGMEERYQNAYAKLVKMVGEFYKQGVTVVAGSDTIPGFGLHRELELYVQGGIPAVDALQLATIGAARVMKRADQLGSIAPGKLADLVLVEGDPTQRIADVRKSAWVMKGGTLYEPSDLYAAIGLH